MAGVLTNRTRVNTNTPPPSDPSVTRNTNNSGYGPYNAEPEVPATHYAGMTGSALASPHNVPASTSPRLGAPVVSARFRRNGLRYMRGYGGVAMPTPQQYKPVESSKFQRTLIHLHDAQFNDKWYIAFPMSGGLLRKNPGLSFRAAQIATRTSGGPGGLGTVMRPRPRFGSVQLVPRYSASPTVYQTTSTKG